MKAKIRAAIIIVAAFAFLFFVKYLAYIPAHNWDKPLGQSVEVIEEKSSAVLLDESLKTKTYTERITVKSEEIDKVGTVARTAVKGYEIEIIDIVKTSYGVDAYARVWDDKNKQIAFGDGTIDIERFAIVNPPLLVEDPLGDIVRVNTLHDGSISTTTYRLDPKQALLNTIAHAVSVSPKPTPKIIEGKVGNTTTTCYPDADAESTSVDGFIRNQGATYATVQSAGTGSASNDNLGQNDAAQNTKIGATFYIDRMFFLCDSSAIADTDVVSAATLSLMIQTKADGGADNDSINVYSSNPASDTALATADFDAVGTTAYATAKDIGSDIAVSTTVYNDWTLNATGLAAISLTGITKFSVRTIKDVSATTPAAQSGIFDVFYADNAGTSKDPVLTITHAAGASPSVPENAQPLIIFE